uniref:Cytochrome P450 n=1 Tax=Oryza rufipogon TaxID=4529 RepID=A0A0E0R877_ORYRU
MAARTWLWLLLSPLILLLLHYALALLTARRARKNPLPPSPPALPFIGHLHLIGALPHVSLCRLATKHAPDLMFLRLGTSLPAILRTHDDVFASRPRTVLADIIFYGSRDIGFAPYGEDWRQARKLVNTHLLSVNKVQSLWLAREEEVKIVMEKISKAAFAREAVDIGQILCSFTNDLACRVVSRKLVGDDRQKKLLQELVNKTIKLLSIFNVEEYFSILARIGVIGKVMCARAERLKKKWDMLLKKLIADHESKCDPYLVCGRNKDDFVDILLSVRKEYGLTEEHVKAILEDVFIAGTQSSARVIEFTFAELMRKPHMLKKVQDEVRACIPNGQAIVSEVQVNNMTYLRAVVKEFMPERFVESVNGSATASVNFWVNNYQYLPFGSGRRMCLGMNFAMAVIEITLANLLWKFDWALPAHAMEVDMSEEFGLSVRLKEKLLLVPKQHV